MVDPSLLTHLRGYVGFGEESARSLQGLGSRLRPHFTRIVKEFYQAVLADPVARAVLRDDAQIERLRVSLHDWLDRLVTGPYDAEYLEKRARIGRVHVQVGLEQRYMLAAMNLIRLGLHRAVAETAADPPGEFEEHQAIDQICDIELAIMLEAYREDYVLKKTAEAESFATMGRLTAGLAHEIRNPLNAAKLQLEVLRRNATSVTDGVIRRKINRRTNIVQDELQRLSMLLDDFLNLVRARTLEPIHCDACELMTEVIELRGPELESQGIELIADLSDSCMLYAERDRLKQVVNNLITNAVEAVIGGESPEIRVKSRVSVGDRRWEVIVVDNGPGVPPEIADRAFESFVTTKDAGTGLGLSIVKRIVDLHGGSAQLEAADGGGTRASFWIPMTL